MKKIRINLKLNDEQKKAIFNKLLQHRRLFFLVFWGALLVYSFNLLYNKAYIDVNFANYEGSSDFIGTYREGSTLEKIMQNIEKRKTNLENNKSKIYKDPFISAEDDKGSKNAM
jgi:hypothetical protein